MPPRLSPLALGAASAAPLLLQRPPGAASASQGSARTSVWRAAGKKSSHARSSSLICLLPSYLSLLPLEKRLASAQAAPVSQERRRRRPAQTTTTGLEVPRDELVDPHVFIVASPTSFRYEAATSSTDQTNPTYRTANQRRPSTYRRSYLSSRSATSMGFPKPALTPEYFTFVVSKSGSVLARMTRSRRLTQPHPTPVTTPSQLLWGEYRLLQAYAASNADLLRHPYLRAALPTTAQCILMFFEGIRTIPGEVRMMLRIYRRGRPNIVEIIFFVIKVSRGRVR